jgi:S-adenosylmethionine:tRNA ribosyltransferase-isomerase
MQDPDRHPDQHPDFDIAHLDYDLPEDRIAQAPLDQRDRAKLLVIDRSADTLTDRSITDLPDLLNPGDLLILNDTRVIHAKFTAHRETGGKIGGLFIRETEAQTWEVMLEGARRCKPGETLNIRSENQDDVPIKLIEKKEVGHWIVRPDSNQSAEQILDRVGQPPLPPYIHRKSASEETIQHDKTRYQTVFATNPGAVAAPTAGLHFTNDLLDRLQNRNIQTARVTLHVGLGTFKPITTPTLTEHIMHEERYNLPEETAIAIRECRKRNARVVAVGTTALRTLESCADPDRKPDTNHGTVADQNQDRDSVRESHRHLVRPGSGTTNLFIYPPQKLRVVDALLTNFHLPRSTLLALIMATAGISRTKEAYKHAVNSNYRFFSYGDAMLIV